MLSKAEAMKRAMKLPGPPAPGVCLVIRPVEVALAWIELHKLEPKKTPMGNPRWDGGVLVLNSTGKRVPVE